MSGPANIVQLDAQRRAVAIAAVVENPAEIAHRIARAARAVHRLAVSVQETSAAWLEMQDAIGALGEIGPEDARALLDEIPAANLEAKR